MMTFSFVIVWRFGVEGELYQECIDNGKSMEYLSDGMEMEINLTFMVCITADMCI